MSSSRLFTPLKIGNVEVKHRIALAPLTRFRNDDQHIPVIEEAGVDMLEYYSQRASVPGTLLISEGTLVAPDTGVGGYANVPGIWNESQIKQWKLITDAVHAKSSFIFMQLWALGRTGDPDILDAEGGYKLKGPSAIPWEEGAPVPGELTEDEISHIIELYAQAAKNAIEAGFDGVEIHGANGYLPDQFTQEISNHRTDRWGGSIENRARFGIEVAKAVVAAVGPARVGYRISPRNTYKGMSIDDPVPQFTYLVKELKQLGLAYLHAVVSGDYTEPEDVSLAKSDFVVQAWGQTDQQPILLAGGLTPEIAQSVLDEIYPSKNVVAVFGRHFLANPDLPFRIEKKLALNEYDRHTFYTAKSPRGYADYPFSKEFVALQVEG